MFSKATSDPYVKVFVCGNELAKTSVVSKNLNPEWNEKVLVGHMVGSAKVRKNPSILLRVFDKDACSADDPMGDVELPIMPLLNGASLDQWLPVQPCAGCKKAKGELRVVASLVTRKAIHLSPGERIACSGRIAVGMGWDRVRGGAPVDVDTRCVAGAAARRGSFAGAAELTRRAGEGGATRARAERRRDNRAAGPAPRGHTRGRSRARFPRVRRPARPGAARRAPSRPRATRPVRPRAARPLDGGRGGDRSRAAASRWTRRDAC